MKYLIPTSLETERLSLRMFRESDWQDLHEYYGDPECTTYTYGRPLKDYETWRQLAALVGHWELRGYGSYALEEKACRKVLRVVGIGRGPDRRTRLLVVVHHLVVDGVSWRVLLEDLQQAYAQVTRAARGFAGRLDRAGLGAGDKVLLWGENSAEWLACYWGAVIAGVIVVLPRLPVERFR